MLIHIYVSSPVRLTLVVPMGISHRAGRFGTVLTTNVPKLAGGSARSPSCSYGSGDASASMASAAAT